MNELKKIRVLQKKYESKLQNRINEIFDKLVNKEIDTNAFDLKELTSRVLIKPYITDKEKRLIYKLIQNYRKEEKPDLICKKRLYGFAQTIEEMEYNARNRIQKSIGGLTSVKKTINETTKRLGISYNTINLIENKVTELMEK